MIAAALLYFTLFYFILFFLFYALILKPSLTLCFSLPDYDLDGPIFMMGSSPTEFSFITGCDPDSSAVLVELSPAGLDLYIFSLPDRFCINRFLSKFPILFYVFSILCIVFPCCLITSSFLSCFLPISPSYSSFFTGCYDFHGTVPFLCFLYCCVL